MTSTVVTSSPGTGKSFLVKEIVQCPTSLDKSVQLTCLTGIVYQVPQQWLFTNLLVSAIGDTALAKYWIVFIEQSKIRYGCVGYKTCETLIVDECSMISENSFEAIERACRVKCPTQLFGGLQSIFVGDFHQLSPVVNNLNGDNGNYCFQS